MKIDPRGGTTTATPVRLPGIGLSRNRQAYRPTPLIDGATAVVC
jgi:hypothetical protein